MDPLADCVTPCTPAVPITATALVARLARRLQDAVDANADAMSTSTYMDLCSIAQTLHNDVPPLVQAEARASVVAKTWIELELQREIESEPLSRTLARRGMLAT